MSTAVVVRAGLTRGLVELRQSFTGAELVGQLLWPVVTLVALFLLRGRDVGGVALGTFALPGVLGMFVSFGALLVIQALAEDREDGTLLRAKATPNGVRGYLLGRLVTASGTVLAYLVILLVPGLLIIDGLELGRAATWVVLGWVLVLGLVATQALGAVLGALIRSPRGAAYVALVVLGLVTISGIFVPVTGLPAWLRAVAQAFPMYWLGLGMRAALLPDAAAAVEIGGSWRLAETAAVLCAWALAGLVVAPLVLARMARRESGSALAVRRERPPSLGGTANAGHDRRGGRSVQGPMDEG